MKALQSSGYTIRINQIYKFQKLFFKVKDRFWTLIKILSVLSSGLSQLHFSFVESPAFHTLIVGAITYFHSPLGCENVYIY